MHFDRPERRKNEEEMILPLINVVFLLLIFFMLAGRFVATDALQIQPPQSVSQGVADTRDVIVSVTADGRLALDGESVDDSALRAWIAKRIATDETLPIRLKADGRTESTRIVAIMEILQEAGAKRLKLLTVPTDG